MMGGNDAEREIRPRGAHPLDQPFMLYGVRFVFGMAMYITGVLLVFPRYLLDLHALLDPVAEWLVWYSGVPIMVGTSSRCSTCCTCSSTRSPTCRSATPRRRVTVALTAYNDEDSIAGTVEDFLAHPLVERVIVVNNNSGDTTYARAEQAGALTFDELSPGYGRCVYRCLSEAVQFDDTEFVVLCEGDSTFRAYDIEKLLAYAPHADVVNGSRTVEPLRQYLTQLTAFMYYGNLFVGKLLEAKHLGRGTITDVGTTYKLCRRDALIGLLPHLNPAVNLEFNAHFLDTVLRRGLLLLECPITFHARIGVSKGGNINNSRGLSVGTRMIYGLLSDWKRYA
jgi:hypothetical protein